MLNYFQKILGDFMRFYRLISFRLFILIFLILTTFTIFFSLHYVTIESEQYQEVARQCAKRTSEIVRGSTRHSMLYNHKEDTYDIIETIVEQEGIDEISIYDRKGRIAFSTNKNKIDKVISMDNKACVPCHELSGGIKNSASGKWHKIYKKEDGTRALGFITPIENEESCYTAACHAHKENEKFLGILDVNMSLANMDVLLAENRSKLISTNIAITLLLSLSVGIFIWFFVHVPVNKLIMGTKEISSGNLGYKISGKSKDEIGILASSFNEMSTDLQDAKKEITSWSNELEHRVKEKTNELEKTQKRNIQIEKMASLGQLSATVAHELNNPIAGILTYSKLIQKKLNKDHVLEDEKQSIIKHLKMIESESQRSGDIVKNMLLFSRQHSVEMKLRDINNVIDSSIELISHHLELHNIKLQKHLQYQLPNINVDENQIKQALLALCVNAVEAMENEGTLTIRTECRKIDKFLKIYISDTGKGIPDGVKSQIFEPFYTTKNAVKGVGLGLSSVYAIINKHKGEISVESEVDKGTTFIIQIPLK